MIVTATETIGTIGGGQLEYEATRIAVDMFDAERLALRRFPLGAAMGQCCGGVVEILFEPLAGRQPRWLSDLGALYDRREPAVVATQLSSSNPQKIIVTADGVFGIDPGSADAAMVVQARALLDGKTGAQRDAQALFEPVVSPDLDVALFGAGHVGSALVQVLSGIDCDIRWIDSRRRVFQHVPNEVRAVETADPALEVAAMPPGSYYLVMTHSHALDFDICARILRRGDARYCGLIGSVSKRRRFEKRFREQGLSQDVIDTLVCPIGVDGITGKRPAEIAVSVAAEVLRVRELGAQGASRWPDNVYRIGR